MFKQICYFILLRFVNSPLWRQMLGHNAHFGWLKSMLKNVPKKYHWIF